MPEQRQFQRFEHHFPVEVKYVLDKALRRERTKLINVSAGGALLPINAFLVTGKKVDLEIDVPRGTFFDQVLHPTESVPSTGMAVRAAGEVVRSEFKPEHPGRFCTAVCFPEGFRINNSSGPVEK